MSEAARAWIRGRGRTAFSDKMCIEVSCDRFLVAVVIVCPRCVRARSWYRIDFVMCSQAAIGPACELATGWLSSVLVFVCRCLCLFSSWSVGVFFLLNGRAEQQIYVFGGSPANYLSPLYNGTICCAVDLFLVGLRSHLVVVGRRCACRYVALLNRQRPMDM